MSNENYTEFDKTQEFEEKIKPLIAEMKKICKLQKIPFFLSIAYANKDGETAYSSDGVMPGSNFLTLYDDKFSKHLLVLQGARVDIQRNDEDSIADYIASNMDVDEDDAEDI